LFVDALRHHNAIIGKINKDKIPLQKQEFECILCLPVQFLRNSDFGSKLKKGIKIKMKGMLN